MRRARGAKVLDGRRVWPRGRGAPGGALGASQPSRTRVRRVWLARSDAVTGLMRRDGGQAACRRVSRALASRPGGASRCLGPHADEPAEASLTPPSLGRRARRLRSGETAHRARDRRARAARPRSSTLRRGLSRRRRIAGARFADSAARFRACALAWRTGSQSRRAGAAAAEAVPTEAEAVQRRQSACSRAPPLRHRRRARWCTSAARHARSDARARRSTRAPPARINAPALLMQPLPRVCLGSRRSRFCAQACGSLLEVMVPLALAAPGCAEPVVVRCGACQYVNSCITSSAL